MNSNEFILERLKRPTSQVDVVLDTDTYNEVDDQFALAYMIRSSDKLNIKGIYAAPFLNEKSKSPMDGMEKSYKEIANVLNLCGRSDLMEMTFRGSPKFLPDEHTPVDSPAERNLVELAMAQPDDKPLYVIGIAAITNVASALLMNPDIAKKIVVVWLGGNAFHWPDTREFNLYGDVSAARVLFGSGVPVVQLPCMGVVTHLNTTGPEITEWLRGKNELCDYLCDIVFYEEETVKNRKVWNRVIWDISAVAWLLHDAFTDDIIVHSPMPTYDGYYTHDETRHFSKYVYMVHRDPIFEDLFKKLAEPAGEVTVIEYQKTPVVLNA